MKKGMILLLLVAAMAGLLILSAGCQPKKPAANGGTGGLECTKQEAYKVSTPYNETEFYYVEVGVGRPFCTEEPYTDYDVKAASLGKVCQISVKNKGNITGDWTMKAKFITTNSGGGPESEPVTHEIKPGETVRFDFTYDQSDTPSNCINACTRVSATAEGGCKSPFVEVCKYSFYTNETRTRTVTKYKEETRYKTVPCD